jgi:hypothetical protein
MIEPDINQQMARFAPSQNPADPGFDAIEKAVAGMSGVPMQKPEPVDMDIDRAVQDIAAQRRQDMASSLMAASEVNPDEAAQADALGRRFGVGQDIALRNMSEMRRQAMIQDTERMDLLRKDPVLARYIADREFAAQSSDDVGVLAKLQPLVFEAAMLQTPGGFFRVVGRGYERGRAISERGDIGTRVMAGFAGQADLDRAKQLTEEMQALGQQGILGSTAEMIAQNVGQLRTIGTTTVAGAAAGGILGPAGAVAGGAIGATAGIVASTGTMEAGNLYLDMREQGVSDDAAIPAAVAGGFLNGVIEAVGMKIAAKPFRALASKVIREEVAKAVRQPTMRAAFAAGVRAYGLQVGTEATEEGLQEIVAVASEELAKAADGIDSETSLRDAAGRVIEAFAYGGMASALLGGIGPGANLVVDLRRASATQRQQDFFNGLAENRKESKLAQRNPQGYERFLAAQANGTPAETIYVDAATARDILAQSGTTTAQLEDILPGIRERIEKAVETGGDVTIPTSQFGARLANTELGNALLPHMRLAPEAMSAAEAQAFEAQRQAVVEEARTILATKQDADAAFVAEAQQVEDEAFEQVRAVGQFTDIEARTIAKLRQAMVVVDAAEAGMTPAQYQRERGVPLVVRGEGMAAPMAQAARIDTDYTSAVERGDMEAAQRMVDEAAIASGYTIEAFHGTPKGGFTEFNDSPRGLFFTSKPSIAQGYTYFRNPWLSPSEDAAIYRTRLRMQNPLVVDALGKRHNNIPFPGREWRPTVFGNVPEGAVSVEEAARLAFESGHDGIIIKNVMDSVLPEDRTRSTVYVVPAKEQAKLADPVTRDEASNIVPLSRRFDITSPKLFKQAAMSTRVPTAVKPLEDALNDILLADYPTFLQDAKFVSKNLAKFKQLGAPVRIDETATEQQQLEQIIEHMSGNLLWLHDTMDADIRERAKMWYVGGRRLVDWLAERHGLSPMQAATVFAVLSPQKNWYENVGLGIRIIDIVATQGNTKMDTDMQEAYLSSLRKEVTKRQGQLDKHDEKKPKRGKAEIAKWQEQRDEIAKALDAAASKVNEAQGNIDDIGDRTLDQVLAAREFFLAAIMVRWFDQTKNDRTYPVISPEGGVGSPMLTEAGTPASIRYGSYNEVAKAISAYVDGRAENVHLLIGGEHKVRNFYNNLFNPADPRFATIDTHAIAAAYLMPLAGTDALVAHGLGGGVGNAMFGLGGGYAVFYEAYRRAADARGIDPREMQSITWEAIRGMFEAAMKGGLKAPVAAIWKRYVDGEIDIDAARAEVMQRAGGITTPSWVALPVDMQPNAGYSGVSRTAADEQAKNLAAEPTAAAIMFEVAPDPANEELKAKWKALSPLRRQEISVRVAETIIPRVLQEYGIAADMVLQVGGWKGDTNVGFALRMPPGPLVRQIARTIGEALSQEGMFSISATEFKGSRKTGVIRLQLQPGLTPDQIGDLYGNTLYKLGIQGHATFNDSMVIAIDKGVDTDVLARTIADAVAGDSRVIGITQYEGWTSYDETRINAPTPSAEGDDRGAEGVAGRRRIDVYRLEAKRLVEQYLGESAILEQAAAGPARGGIDPRTLNVLVGKGGDVSTLVHELIHLRIGEYLRMARSATPPARVTADLDILFDFMGVKGDTFQERLDNYETMPLEQRRPLEEKVTYNAEIYVYEGKAPSVELRGVFERLSAWMRRVYKSIRDDLNAIYRREFGTDLPILTPEVRAVFDRMLASEEQIKRQEAIEGMKGLFQTQAESGMDNAEWAAYQAMQQEATEAAVTDLNTASMRQVQWLGNARARILRDLQKKHDAKRKEVTAEVAAAVKVEPVYRAMTYLRYGRFVDTDGQEVEVEGTHRLDIEKVRAMYAGMPSEEAMAPARAAGFRGAVNVRPDITSLGTGKYGMLGKDGLDPDMVAEMFGYSSGDEMVRAMLAAKPMKDAVAERTDAEMLRRYGDMNTPAALEAEVQKALHNEARARFVAVELRHIAKATQPVRVMLETAKQVAADMISDMTVRDVRPSEFVAAEARAARDAERIQRTYGITEPAPELAQRYGTDRQQALIRAKRAQLYQNQLAAEALRVKEYVDKQVKYLRRVLRDENVKRMGAAAADQVAGLLERFEVAQVSLKRLEERRSMAQFLADLEAAGVVPDIAEEIANEARRVNYKELKVSEFRDLVDAVRQIEHVGKNEQKMRLAEERAAFEEVRDEIVTRIRAVGKVRGLKVDPRTPLTGIGRAAAFLRGFAAQHLKAASVARVLDGGKEDGPLWNAIIRTANDASDMETRMRAEASLKLGEILKPVFALGGMGGKGIYFRSIGRSLNREARIAIALNMGNDGNRQRLLDGEGWTLEQLQPVLESLTEAEWQAVQQVWDFIDGYRPEIAAKERRLYGKEPEWVTPVPFTVRTSDGKEVSLQGGYYPVKYDPVASDRVATVDAAEEAKRDLQGAYTAATTRRSFVKARAKEVRDRPILYTLDAAFSGVNDVIHDLAWHEWLISTNRLLRDVKFANAVRETRGPEFLKQLRDWTKDNATGARGQQVAGEAVLSWLRQGISASGLGFNVVSAAMQVTGFNQSIVRVGAKYIGQGIVQFSTSPFESAKTVAEKSSFMAERGRTQFREINEIKNRVRGQTEVARRVTAGTYFLMMNMQRSVDIPTWLGAYQKALDAGKDDAKAVALADQAVRDSQGSGLVSDLAAVERGGPAMKLFTVFYSYMNTVYNMTAVQTMTARGKGKLAADYAMLLVVPVVLGYAIKSAIQPDAGDDELDPEALARKLAAEELSYLMGTMVIAREFGGAAQLLTGAEGVRMGYGGPAGLRAVGEVYGLATQAGQLEFDRAFRRSAINTLGAFTGLPSAQINRTIDGIEALVEGEVTGPTAVLAPLTGVQR